MRSPKNWRTSRGRQVDTEEKREKEHKQALLGIELAQRARTRSTWEREMVKHERALGVVTADKAETSFRLLNKRHVSGVTICGVIRRRSSDTTIPGRSSYSIRGQLGWPRACCPLVPKVRRLRQGAQATQGLGFECG